jgi:hypothetical protein
VTLEKNDGSVIRVGDLLDQGRKFDKLSMPSPLDGLSYGRGNLRLKTVRKMRKRIDRLENNIGCFGHSPRQARTAANPNSVQSIISLPSANAPPEAF